jgi:hypothetical protein
MPKRNYHLFIVDGLSNHKQAYLDPSDPNWQPLYQEMSDAVVTKVRWELNAAGEIDFTLPQNSPDVLLPKEGQTDVLLHIQGFVDPVHMAMVQKGVDTPRDATFTCPGVLDYFSKRFITNTSLSYGYNPDHSPQPTGVDQLDIFADLVRQAQRNYDKDYTFNIGVFPYSLSGIKRYREYDIFEHKNFLTDIMAEFPDLTDDLGNPTGFDFGIDLSQFDDITLGGAKIKMWHPHRGSKLDFPYLEYGRNIVDYQVTTDASKLALETYFTGGSNGDIKFENHYSDFLLDSLPYYGLVQEIRSQSGENDVGVLLRLAQRWCLKYRKPTVLPDITVVETPDTLLGEINPGDTIKVKIQNGRTNLNDYYRVQYVEWLPGPGNLKIGIFDDSQ